nr:unnamed protein product [Callosobruchus chinensis]
MLVPCLVIIYFQYFQVNGQSFAADTKINPKELKCLVCEKTVLEIDKAISQISPDKMIEIGGFRLDEEGNYHHKTVPQSKSELALSEVMETICDKMDNYIRALWKENGTLTLLSMTNEAGFMNPSWSDVDIIQDDDLNKSLKYNCEGIIEEYEERLIEYYLEGTEDIAKELCMQHTKLCGAKEPRDEL